MRLLSQSPPRSLRRNLLGLGIWPCAITALILTGWFTRERLALLDSVFAAQGQATARQIAALSDLSLYAGDLQTIQSIASSAVAAEMAERVEISNNAGIFVSAGALPAGASPQGFSSTPIQLLRLANLADYTDTTPEPGIKPVTSAPSLGTVRIYRDTSLRDKEKQRSLLWGLLPGLACLLLAMLVARRMGHNVTFALHHITQALDDLCKGRLSADSKAASRNEVYLPFRELFRINHQVQQLGEQWKIQQQEASTRLQQTDAQARINLLKMEQASRTRTRFLAAASHDLRQQLHTMGLFIDNLQVSATAGQQTPLKRLQESAQLMENLLNDLLDITRLDSDISPPQYEAISLERLFGDLDTLYRPQAQQKAIDLQWRARGFQVYADQVLLRRLLGNLVSNAIQHGQAKRIVVVARQDYDSTGHNARIRLEVRDNGCGIAALHHTSIFEEFYQLDNAGRDARKGFGLGLSICARIAAALDTRIQLHSALQQGSTFALSLAAASTGPLPTRAGRPGPS